MAMSEDTGIGVERTPIQVEIDRIEEEARARGVPLDKIRDAGALVLPLDKEDEEKEYSIGTAEVSRLTGIAPNKIRAMAQHGNIPSIRIEIPGTRNGQSVYQFRDKDIEYLKQRRLNRKNEIDNAFILGFSMTTSDVARELSLTPQRVINYAKQGRLPSRMIHWRGAACAYKFRPEDVEWVKGHLTSFNLGLLHDEFPDYIDTTPNTNHPTEKSSDMKDAVNEVNQLYERQHDLPDVLAQLQVERDLVTSLQNERATLYAQLEHLQERIDQVKLLRTRVDKLEDENQALVYRNGYLQAQLDSTPKPLVDDQPKRRGLRFGR